MNTPLPPERGDSSRLADPASTSVESTRATSPRHIGPIGFLVRIVVVATLLFAGLVLLATALAPPPRMPLAGDVDVRLADGTWVSARVTVGTKHEWKVPHQRTWLDWYKGKRPPTPLNFSPSTPELFVWLVRHDGQSYRSMDWFDMRHARLEVAGETIYPERIDVYKSQPPQDMYSSYSTSPPYRPESYSVKVNGTAYVYGLHFPLPPAGCGPLSLTLLGDRPNDKTPRPALVTLTLPEPNGLNPRATWTASPFPASSTVGPYTLTIKELSSGGSSYNSEDEFSNRVHFNFRVEMTADGAACTTRIVEHGPLTDSAGNVQTRGYQYGARLYFPPHRYTLTAQVPAQVPAQEALKATSRGAIPDLPIPPENTRQVESKPLALRDGRVRLKTIAVGGRGKVVHPDPTPTSTSQWGYYGGVENLQFQANRRQVHSSRGSTGPVELTMESRLVHLVYEAEGIGPRETLVIASVRDDQNRDVKFNDFFHNGTRMVVLNPATDARSFQVEWEIQDTEVFEFTTNPPALPPDKK